MLRSAPALVATCTAMFGLHSSSSTTSSYSYFALGSALRSLTARSAELRPPSPLAAVPPVSGPMKATLTLSLAATGNGRAASTAASAMAESDVLLIMGILWAEPERHAAALRCVGYGRPAPRGEQVHCMRRTPVVSPAGLTTQVGFIRLAHLNARNRINPISAGPSPS